MNNIIISDNNCILKLSKKFYAKKAIDSVISSFQEYCSCSSEENDDNYQITLSDSELCYDFFNHVLAEMKNTGLV